MSKLIIAGSRDITDMEELLNAFQFYKNLFNIRDIDLIISGGARGVDKLAEQFAHEHSINMQIFNASWTKHGKSAGVIRNIEMAREGDMLLVIWDGKSLGTQHMINAMHAQGKPVYIWPVKKFTEPS